MEPEDTTEQHGKPVEPASDQGFAEAPTEAPVPGGSPEPATPGSKRSGFIFTVVAAAVLVFALLGTAFVLMQAQNRAKSGPSQTTNSQASAAKARVVAASDFLKYLFAGDSLGMKTLLTDDAQNAITAAQWADVASAIPTAAATYDPLTWSSDTTASFAFNVEDTTGTIVAGAAPGATGTVDVVLTAGGSVETAQLQLLRQGATWRVLSLTDQTGAVNTYDAAFVKQLYQDATTQ